MTEMTEGEKILTEALRNSIHRHVDINDALAEVKDFESQLKRLEWRKKLAEKKLHQLLWNEMIERELIAEDHEMTGDPDSVLYSDRDTECKSSPIGTCVELGWHDECIYCGSLRYSMVEVPEPPPKRIIKEGIL